MHCSRVILALVSSLKSPLYCSIIVCSVPNYLRNEAPWINSHLMLSGKGSGDLYITVLQCEKQQTISSRGWRAE